MKEITVDQALGGPINVREQATAPGGVKLVQEWCECGDAGTFLCYPEDGTCTCGEWKHHVHCVCGKISQTG
jgi:hypothetical protein